MVLSTSQLVVAGFFFFFSGLGFLLAVAWVVDISDKFLNRNAFPAREKNSHDGYL